MKVLKKINNNVAICIDNEGNELIAVGRGIGFRKIPYELKDMKDIRRTYYNVDAKYFDLINLIDLNIIDIATEIIDYARFIISYKLSPNIVFTLADHIQFAIERYKEGQVMPFMMSHDLQNLYEKECSIGQYALELIAKELKVILPKDEKYSIALHFINFGSIDNVSEDDDSKLVDDIVEIIERSFEIKINKDGATYSRFLSHLQYLIRRVNSNELFETENHVLYENIVDTFPQSSKCANEINEYFKNKKEFYLGDEELLYLMLHINRLCIREDP